MPAAIQFIGLWTRPLASLERCRARYGQRFTIRFPLAPPFVILSDPDEIKEVFRAPPDVLHPGEGARVLEPIVGKNSVILLDEAAHMEQRKLMLPAFHGEKMARLSGLMTEVAEREVASWPRDRTIVLAPRLQRLTLEIILRAVFGLDPGERLDALRERLGEMLAFGDRPISLLPPDPDGFAARVLERIGPFAQFVRMQAQADRLIFELIDERRAGDGERDDVLAMLLAARHEDGSPMSNQELRDELMTLLVAGHETTAAALAWAFERLARHPASFERLRAEAAEDGDDYVDAVAKETLRVRTVITFAIRHLARPFRVGDREFPAGVRVAPCVHLVHRRPDLYPEPEAFRPERFLDRPATTYGWIPFGGGTRRCLGGAFAVFEMKTVLRVIARAGRLRPAEVEDEAVARRGLALVPAKGGRVLWEPAPVG
jgi:cytochrome P450